MRVACLSGDGIGPEVMAQGTRVLQRLLPDLEREAYPLGAAAIREFGTPLPAETLAGARGAAAVLLGAVGEDFDWREGVNAEDALFTLRKELDVFANLRPVRYGDADLLIVRELVGGLYFGRRGTLDNGLVFDTCEYHPDMVERVARSAFDLASARRGRVTSVDKANVLATSRMWRRVVEGVAADYPQIALDHMLVDTAAMVLARDPGAFDVILTENTFGDILSDVAAIHGGGLGMLASASIGATPPGLFEPVHGTAPDIAGTGKANPAAMIGSIALMIRHTFEMPEMAAALEDAVLRAAEAAPTADLGGGAGTEEFGDAVLAALDAAGVSASDPGAEGAVH